MDKICFCVEIESVDPDSFILLSGVSLHIQSFLRLNTEVENNTLCYVTGVFNRLIL